MQTNLQKKKDVISRKNAKFKKCFCTWPFLKISSFLFSVHSACHFKAVFFAQVSFTMQIPTEAWDLHYLHFTTIIPFKHFSDQRWVISYILNIFLKFIFFIVGSLLKQLADLATNLKETTFNINSCFYFLLSSWMFKAYCYKYREVLKIMSTVSFLFR